MKSGQMFYSICGITMMRTGKATSVFCYSAECHDDVTVITRVWASVFFSLAALSQSEWSLGRDTDSESHSQINWPSGYQSGSVTL